MEEVRGHSTLTLHIFSFRTPALYIGSLVNGDLASWVIYSCKNVISMQRNSLIPNLYNSLFYAYVKPCKQVDAVLIVAEEPIFAFNHSHSGPLPHILLREGMGVEILTAQTLGQMQISPESCGMSRVHYKQWGSDREGYPTKY